MSSPLDPVSIIVPVGARAERLEPRLHVWSEFLQKELGRDYEIILVHDATGTHIEQIVGTMPTVRTLCLEQPGGFGACLRAALAVARFPVIFYTALDYPYHPPDLLNLLKRLGETVPVYDVPRTVEAVTGCRTGRPTPLGWRIVGRTYRTFMRIALGIPVPPLAGWLGFRPHARSWYLWLTLGIPLTDVTSAFKVFRRSVFDRFPIQSGDDFVHSEIFAKLTFLSVLVDEIALAPRPDPIPNVVQNDRGVVIRDARFHSPLPDLTAPPSPTA